jgi:hypothetical protein
MAGAYLYYDSLLDTAVMVLRLIQKYGEERRCRPSNMSMQKPYTLKAGGRDAV